MAGNPADGLWAAITAAILRLELLSAAAVDRHERVGPLVISALAGTTAAMVSREVMNQCNDCNSCLQQQHLRTPRCLTSLVQ